MISIKSLWSICVLMGIIMTMTAGLPGLGTWALIMALAFLFTVIG